MISRRQKTVVRSVVSLVAVSFLFVACAQKIPKEALQLSHESLKDRQIQSRRFVADEKTVLSASAAVLQDLGYTIDESETDLGVIVCSKTRDATSAGQIVGSVLVALLTGVASPVDKEQLIRASLITNPVYVDEEDDSNCRTTVRVTFQRIVTNTQGQVTRRECINEAEIYQEFFDKLSQSLFLEAHEI